MIIYYCKYCKKIIGEAQQGKKGIMFWAMECYECIRPCYSTKEIEKALKTKFKQKTK